MARRTAAAGLTGRSIESSRPRRRCLARSLLPEGAETRCVVKGRANPACQRAPATHADFRAPGSAGSAWATRFTALRPLRLPRPSAAAAFSTATVPGSVTSGAPEPRALPRLATDDLATVLEPTSLRCRVNGLGAPRESSAPVLANRRESRARQRVTLFPRRHRAMTAGLSAVGGRRGVETPYRPVAPSARARVWLRGGPLDPVTDTPGREAPRAERVECARSKAPAEAAVAETARTVTSRGGAGVPFRRRTAP